jgi:hypothetical protein
MSGAVQTTIPSALLQTMGSCHPIGPMNEWGPNPCFDGLEGNAGVTPEFSEYPNWVGLSSDAAGPPLVESVDTPAE